MLRGAFGRVFGQRWVDGATVCLAVSCVAASAQDHVEHDPADIEYGLAVYLEQCASCHGETGDATAGVDLRNGPLRRAATDRELIGVIRNGIPGTGMLAFELDAAEMAGIVAYLRNMTWEADAVTLGDAARGRALFEGRGACLDCHRVGGRGPRAATDLTSVGAERAASALRRSLLDPTGTMRPIDRPVELVTADGERVAGRRLNEDTYTVQILDGDARLRSFDKAGLRELPGPDDVAHAGLRRPARRGRAGRPAGVPRVPERLRRTMRNQADDAAYRTRDAPRRTGRRLGVGPGAVRAPPRRGAGAGRLADLFRHLLRANATASSTR